MYVKEIKKWYLSECTSLKFTETLAVMYMLPNALTMQQQTCMALLWVPAAGLDTKYVCTL